jgi:NTE family protein
MRTFVLSGGGNRGPLEVGALQVLLESGILPEMIVGSSAGALNGAFLAINPGPEQAKRMADLWREGGRRKFFRTSPWRIILQMLRGRSYLADNRLIAQFVREILPAHMQHFGDLPIPLYVTIAHLLTHTLYVYGDDPAASLADAVVTSAAVPGFFPPTVYGGEVFVDGGVVSNLPVCLALARGATEIWAIDLAYSVDVPRKAGGIFSVLGHTVSPVLYNEALRELEVALRACGGRSGAGQSAVTLHHIPIYAFQDVGLGDFSKTEAMLAEGARVMRAYLAKPEPDVIHYPYRHRVEKLPPGPPGSRPFVS